VLHAERPDPPPRRDCGERLKDEAANGELRVGDSELARTEASATPQQDIEVEDARAPAAPSAPAELTLDRLETAEHPRRI
jgi:hypothetical protein